MKYDDKQASQTEASGMRITSTDRSSVELKLCANFRNWVKSNLAFFWLPPKLILPSSVWTQAIAERSDRSSIKMQTYDCSCSSLASFYSTAFTMWMAISRLHSRILLCRKTIGLGIANVVLVHTNTFTREGDCLLVIATLSSLPDKDRH